ncbi:hypothetical protein AAG570_007136 [Ranatra chinensis]|uniref:Uncharacterized protein n=1 Tax=Ranatra chinensis TaxID=642074 RepID=A0ABD0XXP7_9HEMI
MTEEELRHVFHVWSHHDVPQYEVVGVHSVDGGLPDLEESVPDLKRSVRMYAFGKEMNLNLVSTRSPVTEETPVYEAEANDTGHLHYTRIDQHHFQQKHVGDTYQDEQNQAALLLHRDEDGTILMVSGANSGTSVRFYATSTGECVEEEQSAIEEIVSGRIYASVTPSSAVCVKPHTVSTSEHKPDRPTVST